MDELNPQQLLEQLFDKKLLHILRIFINSPERQFYLREIGKLSRVPIATVHRTIGRLVELEIIREVRIKRFKLYQLEESRAAKFVEGMLELRRTALEEFIEIAKGAQGVEQIILHGRKQKDRANLLIIGHQIDNDAIKRAVGAIKERYQFSVMHLALEPEQFEQMASMGLYSGEKSTLYRRAKEGEGPETTNPRT